MFNIKRLLAWLLALTLLVQVMPYAGLTASAAGSPTITVSAAEATPGSTVTLTVSLNNNTGFAGFALRANYDTSALTLTAFAQGDVLNAVDASGLGSNTAVGVANWATTTNTMGDGTLMTMTFTVNANAPAGDYAVTLSADDFFAVDDQGQFLDYPVQFVAGKVTVATGEHVHSFTTTTVEATCQTPGTVTKTCSSCGYSETTEIPATGIHTYENGACTGCGIGVILNANTGETYSNLETATETAAAGEKLKLQSDLTEGRVMVTPGVTLDLNGHTLTATYLAAFDSAHVIDNVGTGSLIIDEKNLILDDSNSMIPVFNGSAYIFTLAGFAVRQDSKYTGEGIKIQAMVYPVSMNVVNLLKDGGEDNNMSVILRLSWDTDVGVASQEFAFTDELLSGVYSSNQGAWNKYSKMFTMTIKGFSNITNLKANIVVVSDAGVEYVSPTSLTIT